MNWRNKDEFDDPSVFGPGSGRGGGGNRSWFRRVFFRGDDPLRWGIPLFRVRGILVQVGWLFILFAAVELVTAAFRSGFAPAALGVGSLFVLVLLHEFGHCIACRMVGGEADEILMWPLGGLAFCRPPHNWRAEFITVVGGPLVNVLLVPVTALAVHLVWHGQAKLIFNPLTPGLVVNQFASAGAIADQNNLTLYAKMFVWWLYYTNLALLVFNMLPMFPMDGGRILQALLWRRVGFNRSMLIATTVGLVIAVVLGMFAAVSESGRLMAVAIFGGITCWNERRLLSAAREVADESYGSFLGRGDVEGDEDEPAAKSSLKRAAEVQREREEVDRILAKIAREGKDSLTRKERRTLEGATNRLRGS